MSKKDITTYMCIVICLIILAILNVKDEQKLRYFKERYEQSEQDRTSLIKENKMLLDEYIELLETNCELNNELGTYQQEINNRETREVN